MKRKPSPLQRKAMLRTMAERKRVPRREAVSAPANWDTMTEAQRDSWRQEEAEREADTSLDWNPLLGG